MTTNSLNQTTTQQTITSMEIAEITGKKHYHVLAAIRNMEPAWEKTAATKFRCSSTKDKSGKQIPIFVLTKTECLYVATKFNDEARAKLVLRWEELEKEKLQQTLPSTGHETANNLPADPAQLTRKQLLLMALEAEEEKERLRAEKEELEMDKYGLMIENGHQAEQILRLEQRNAYLNVIMADRSTVTVTQIAQDYGMAAKAFNELLRGLRIHRKVGEQWVLYADFITAGYVATRMIPIHHAGGHDTMKPMTVWTQPGRKFLYDRLKKHGVLPLIERASHQQDASLSII